MYSKIETNDGQFDPIDILGQAAKESYVFQKVIIVSNKETQDLIKEIPFNNVNENVTFLTLPVIPANLKKVFLGRENTAWVVVLNDSSKVDTIISAVKNVPGNKVTFFIH